MEDKREPGFWVAAQGVWRKGAAGAKGCRPDSSVAAAVGPALVTLAPGGVAASPSRFYRGRGSGAPRKREDEKGARLHGAWEPSEETEA